MERLSRFGRFGLAATAVCLVAACSRGKPESVFFGSSVPIQAPTGRAAGLAGAASSPSPLTIPASPAGSPSPAARTELEQKRQELSRRVAELDGKLAQEDANRRALLDRISLNQDEIQAQNRQLQEIGAERAQAIAARQAQYASRDSEYTRTQVTGNAELEAAQARVRQQQALVTQLQGALQYQVSLNYDSDELRAVTARLPVEQQKLADLEAQYRQLQTRAGVAADQHGESQRWQEQADEKEVESRFSQRLQQAQARLEQLEAQRQSLEKQMAAHEASVARMEQEFQSGRSALQSQPG
jgi:chromosome segregation ATPase